MRATTCPFFTGVLKSAYSARMFPETCEPTCTVTTAFGVPVADTVDAISPHATGAVRYWASTGPRSAVQAPKPITVSVATVRIRTFRFVIIATYIDGAWRGACRVKILKAWYRLNPKRLQKSREPPSNLPQSSVIPTKDQYGKEGTMSKFMLLLYSDPVGWSKLTPDQAQKATEKYMAWTTKPFTVGSGRLAGDVG